MVGERPRHLYREIKSTPEGVDRFWDYLAGNPAAEGNAFSGRFARRILRLGLRGARVAGPVVDFGCGPAFLCAELLRDGHEVLALDRSPRSLERVRARFAAEPRFLGGLLERHGLAVRWLRAANFKHLPDRAAGQVLAAVLRAFPGLGSRTEPHLIAVAERVR